MRLPDVAQVLAGFSAVPPASQGVDVCTVVIDVSEQEIERPVKRQKSYYSGKKNGSSAFLMGKFMQSLRNL